MDQEAYNRMVETGKAPCGCATTAGPGWRTTAHDENCQIYRPDDALLLPAEKPSRRRAPANAREDD